MSETNLDPSQSAKSELQSLLAMVQVLASAERAWERLFTPAECQQLGGDCRASFDAHPNFVFGRTVGQWMEVKQVSQPRAIVELALGLGFTDEPTANWLLRELGEAEIGKEAAKIPDRPVWDKETRQLMFGGQLARRVQNPNKAHNIVAVLDALQEEGWPPRIDDPLPHGADRQRLNATVEMLNNGLELIRFSADGTGEGIAWQVVP